MLQVIPSTRSFNAIISYHKAVKIKFYVNILYICSVSAKYIIIIIISTHPEQFETCCDNIVVRVGTEMQAYLVYLKKKNGVRQHYTK